MKNKRALINWTGDLQFIGTDSGNHSIVISSHDDDNHTGMRPSELLLLALGSCSAYDVVKILKKKKGKLRQLHIEISATQADSPPTAFTQIELAFFIAGSNITEKAVDQAIQLSLERYCSVAATIEKVAEISYSYTLEQT